MASNLKPEYGPARKVNPVPRRLAETGNARQKIGFEAQVGLEEGLRRLVAWWQQSKPVAETASV
jgi:UDP-glucose 4-epimerase